MPKSIIGRIVNLFSRTTGGAAPSQADSQPAAGSLFGFRTSPFSEYSPSDTGRYAAFKILGSNADVVTVAVLEGIWTTPPTYSEASASPILREQRFTSAGRLAVFGVNAEWWNTEELKEVAFLGTVPLSDDERKIAKRLENGEPGSSYSTLNYANYHAEGEWRWSHDRDALMAEVEKVKAKNEAARAAQEERYQNRLRHLTWDQLLAETPFSGWTPSPPFPPDEFIAAARDVIHDACRDLKALGPKPRKAEVRAVLKRCVTWFNEADARFDGVIETEEREDICAVLEEMAFVARQKSLVDEIDTWREW
jgi:hypothetical protein